MKKIIIASDSYKGSLSAKAVCNIIGDVAKEHFPNVQIIKLPVADGGEGLVDAMLSARKGEKVWITVKDPLMRDITAYYGVLEDGTVIIEMAAASGLPLLRNEERNVLDASTYGTGQLIADALSKGYRKFVIGLGGSATNDGGAGVGSALGIKYIDKNGGVVISGRGLQLIEKIDATQKVFGLNDSTFLIACDVTNPLFGPNGAAHIYGPQKGASPEDVILLDEGLKKLASIIRKETNLDVQSIPGTGAAGGMVIPFLAFTKADLKQGVEIVLDAINFNEHLKGCDLLITGEGRSDQQSSMGKILSGIGVRAKRMGVPVIAISGALNQGYEKLYDYGINALFSTVREVTTLENALENAVLNLRTSTEDVFRLIDLAINLE